MSDPEWQEFEGYVIDRLKIEKSFVFGEASWRREFTFPYPGFPALVKKYQEKLPDFVLKSDFLSGGQGLLFACYCSQ